MTDLVKCDRCGTPFSIQTAGIRSTWSGDYMVQYFTCPGCHHRYQILTTDTELRQTVQQHKKIAAKRFIPSLLPVFSFILTSFLRQCNVDTKLS